MQQISKPASKLRVALTWLLVVGVIVFSLVFWAWWFHEPAPVEPVPATPAGSAFMLIVAAFFICVGLAGYAIVIVSNCFTPNLDQPVWNEIRIKLYIANILVPLFPAMGVGFAAATFLAPMLVDAGLSSEMAHMVPVFGSVALCQIIQLWVFVWAPVERRLIRGRLRSQGMTADQIDTAILVGTSNPQRSSFSKMTTVEEDIGGLWIGEDQLVYFGDNEQFSLSRDQVLMMEHKSDAGGTTVLGGLLHTILHVKMPNGSQRQIRLHTEGEWTMGHRRKAMEALAEAIARWHENVTVTRPVAQVS